MTYCKSTIFIFIFIVTIDIYANENLSACKVRLPNLTDLRQTNCSVNNDVSIIEYQTSKSSSPYATDFDRRLVKIALGTNIYIVRTLTRFNEKKSNFDVTHDNTFIQAPNPDQIDEEKTILQKTKFQGWSLKSEQIQYRTQGGAQGFLIDCVTAIKAQGHHVSAVGECFPVEERQKFLQVLKELSK